MIVSARSGKGEILGERNFRNLEWTILIPALLLILIGLVNLYSVGHVPSELQDTFRPGGGSFFLRQLSGASRASP